MEENCNRKIKHIRLSVTSNCNCNCIYCDHEGFVPKTSELTVEEITKLCKILAEILNVTRIKITGGEPLCRKEIIRIIQKIHDLNLYKDISLTTNGLLLDKMAKKLKNAGLNRINVSLCSLNSETYKKITCSDSLDTVIKGLKEAESVELYPIKINFVILKGLNDKELDDMINFCAKNKYILQLIELHNTPNSNNQFNDFYNNYHVDVKPIIKELESKTVKTIIRGNMQNRKVFTMQNGAVIETITPSHEFCMGCTKLRVGCDGNLFGCLNRSDQGKNMKEILRNHHSMAKYEQIVKEVVEKKKPYY